MAEDRGGNVKWVIGAVIVPILVACIGAGVFQIKDGCLPFLCGTDNGPGSGPDIELPNNTPADVFVNKTSGPGGSKVNVSGEGFKAGEQIVISFHTEEMGRTQANGEGKFANVTVTIPTSFSKFAPQKFDIIASGRSSLKAARTPFTISG